MVAEAGLEPTTSGLWVDITLLNVRKTRLNDRNRRVYGGEKSGVSEHIWSWRPVLGSKWGQNFRVKWNDSRKWIIQKQLLCECNIQIPATYLPSEGSQIIFGAYAYSCIFPPNAYGNVIKLACMQKDTRSTFLVTTGAFFVISQWDPRADCYQRHFFITRI